MIIITSIKYSWYAKKIIPKIIARYGETIIKSNFLPRRIPIVGISNSVPIIRIKATHHSIIKKWRIEQTTKSIVPMAETVARKL